MLQKTRLVKDSGIELVNVINEVIGGADQEKDFLARLLELFEHSLLVDDNNPSQRLTDLFDMTSSVKITKYKTTIFNSFAVAQRLTRVALNNV